MSNTVLGFHNNNNFYLWFKSYLIQTRSKIKHPLYRSKTYLCFYTFFSFWSKLCIVVFLCTKIYNIINTVVYSIYTFKFVLIIFLFYLCKNRQFISVVYPNKIMGKPVNSAHAIVVTGRGIIEFYRVHDNIDIIALWIIRKYKNILFTNRFLL